MNYRLAIVTLAVITLACTRTSAAPVSSCSLLSKADVASLIGELKEEPKPDTGLRGEKDCRYFSLEGHWLKTSFYTADRWELEKGITSEQHQTPLPNLGDEAFSAKPGRDSIVYVRVRDVMLEISCSCGMENTIKAATKATSAFTKGAAK